MNAQSLPAAARFTRLLGLIVSVTFVGGSAKATNFVASGATAVGDFSNPLVWSPNGVPGPNDTALLNDNSLEAGGPSLNLTANTTVQQLTLGATNPLGKSARLDLNGFNLVASGSITLGLGGGLSFLDGRSAGGSPHLETPSLLISGVKNDGFKLFTNDRATNLTVQSGARATVTDSQNVSTSVLLAGEATMLTLETPLTLGADLLIRGTGANEAIVDAQGHAITARHIRIGQFGSAGDIQNDGVIHATLDLEVSRGTFTLDANDVVDRGVVATNEGVLTLDAATASLDASALSGGRINTVATGNLSRSVLVDGFPNGGQGSLLDLGADLSLTEDLVIRGNQANQAVVDAHGFDIVARDIRIGQFGSAGTIQNDGVIHATRDLEVSRGTFTLDANDVVDRGVMATNEGVMTLDAATAAIDASVFSGGRINTVATGNLSRSVLVDGFPNGGQGSRLDLGADLALSDDLVIRGNQANQAVVDAHGFDIVARDIRIGQFGSAGMIQNDGVIHATGDLEVSRGMFTLDANDVVDRGVVASSEGVLSLDASTAALDASALSGGRINTVATGNLSRSVLVDGFPAGGQGSRLDLGADLALTEDLVIRGNQASQAVVDAHGFDIVARSIRIGQFGSAGDIQNDGVIHATLDLEVSRGMFTLDANDVVDRGVVATNEGVLTLDAATASLDASALSGGRINTVATGNLSRSVLVDGFPNGGQGSLLDLGADLALTEDLVIRGNQASQAVVDAHGFDIVARSIRIGQFGSAGDIQNDGVIHATLDLEVSRGAFTLDANDVVERTVVASSEGVLTLDAATAALDASVASGGRINTVATGNLSRTVLVDGFTSGQGSRLDLGADLTLSVDLTIRGSGANAAVVDSHGHDITARNVSVGQFNSSGALLNDGLLRADRLFVERSTLTLTGGDDVVQAEIDLRTAATLAVTQGGDEEKGLTFNGATLDILDTSVLSLNFDANTSPAQLELDFAFRWKNPVGGDRIAAINSLVSAGRIVINSPVQTVVFDNDDGYTYVGLTPDPAILAGDYNGDGAVDAADYTVWRDNLGMPEGTLINDISVGPVGEAQYLVWKNRFGNTLTPAVGATAVPEPSVATLCLLLLALSASRRRQPTECF
ncbi:hypothetical protein Pla175_09150 [Pirellulimonas nuda]|uniref:Autotransporter-associated beta strand repeat protein n=1 Tax=Pirellulimonas nuda TaxID=2528009 RepID=A0A518D7V8_9BACT|nr:hypothetical protein [Pirellulimonas nuda]QDU87551.1 hypothetical protein Pla175_09150 [Pirellulimonas nuda]